MLAVTDRSIEKGLSMSASVIPKDGDFFLGRANSGEILMDVHGDSDVQIVCHTLV